MKKEELSINSIYDDLPLGISIRIPENPVGIIQFVHGMAEHREPLSECYGIFYTDWVYHYYS